ncbi:hypothetical protein Q9295_06085 [Xinfangfangia sp. CPCC 101601]|uniref:Uncharacterized protein n=1 Tax=Pseudogemmobacter lacusdianii TaxID=3069608 RepID=A0ABU0VW06_9RHOB|nr:hypothetical protein [Xinfangfangia sp. CPCC 101601]MDQ2065932.1 hypothetical protein [Xinfangfangia sp. CPCC 101601]
MSAHDQNLPKAAAAAAATEAAQPQKQPSASVAQALEQMYGYFNRRG